MTETPDPVADLRAAKQRADESGDAVLSGILGRSLLEITQLRGLISRSSAVREVSLPELRRRAGAALRAIWPKLETTLENSAFLGGALLISFGAWEIYPPAGPIVAGTFLIAGVILHARGS